MHNNHGADDVAKIDTNPLHTDALEAGGITPGPSDPAKEIEAWKAYFKYAAEDLRGESPELLVACAHRLLEMAQETRDRRGGTSKRATRTAS